MGEGGRLLAYGHSADRESYFNITEGMDAALGRDTTHQNATAQGGTVVLDISDVPAGTRGRSSSGW